MPIYEYVCKKCDHLFDVLQKISDEPLTYCPECGEPELRKRVSAPAFRLKGGGWYETDFKTGNKRNLADGGEAKGANGDKPAGDAAKDKPAAGQGGDGKSASAGDSA
ncbi:MAG: zinc ribbon domain-containing protein [Gammaproteobacteria bacterium]|nr:MAG: zinc ribbon domain-containing protein [Gammaproteobacteria bacterium]